MAAGQRLGYAALAPAIDGADCVNDMLRREPSARGDDRLANPQRSDFAHDCATLGKNGRAPGAMNGAVDTAATQKIRVRCIHNRVGGFFGEIGGTMNLNRFAPVEHESHGGVLRGGVQSFHFLSVSASTPGSFFPSRNSSDAPPPVEMWVIFSATPAACAAATESPPPTIEIAPTFSATACAILNVPLENPGTSNTPIGPFHKIVRAREISSEKSSTVFGPISSAILSAGIGWPSQIWCTTAVISGLLATTWSTGNRNLKFRFFASSSNSRASSTLSASSSDLPISCPCALSNVYAIPPPMISESTFFIRF